MKKTTPHQTLSILVLSAKGWGTGSALRAFYIAEALKQRGHRVQFIKPLPTLPYWLDMAFSCPYYFWKTIFTRHQVVLAVKPYPTVIPAMLWQKMLGAKTVIDVDDLDFAYSDGLFRTIHEWLQMPWPRRADWVTYHNPKLKESLLDFFKVDPCKTIQLPQGVNETIFNKKPLNPENLPAKAAALYKAKPRKPILVFTAHLNVACDLEPALYAFKEVLHQIPQAQLLIAGGGPDENHFKKITRDLGIEPSVHFTGLITISQVAACLKISDLTLVYYSDTPVNHHRASMKLREALVCGRPIVATGVGETLQFKKMIFLSNPDPRSYAKRILSVLRTKKTLPPYNLASKKWSWIHCVENLEKELLNEKS